MNPIPRSVLVPSALLAGLCPLVANTVHEDVSGSGEQVVADAAGGLTTTAQISVTLHLVGFAALVVVLATMAAAVAVHRPILAGTTGIAGAAAIAIKLAEAQTGIALRATADEVEPGAAAALVAMDEAGFTVFGFLLSLALGAAALGLLRSGIVPSWLGWWGAVAGGLGVLTAVVGIAWPPHYVPIPFMLLLLWLVALGVTAARRPLADSSPMALASTPQ